MAYIKKVIVEEKFVNMLLEIGIKTVGCSTERGNDYYFIDLKDGQRRYWTNFNLENQVKIGYLSEDEYQKIKEVYPNE